jgi:excisionase family DNA binding protein
MSIQPSNFSPRYYTQKQIIQLTALSRSTLERLERAKKMPAPRRFGNCKRFLITEIHEWLEGNWPKEGE